MFLARSASRLDRFMSSQLPGADLFEKDVDNRQFATKPSRSLYADSGNSICRPGPGLGTCLRRNARAKSLTSLELSSRRIIKQVSNDKDRSERANCDTFGAKPQSAWPRQDCYACAFGYEMKRLLRGENLMGLPGRNSLSSGCSNIEPWISGLTLLGKTIHSSFARCRS